MANHPVVDARVHPMSPQARALFPKFVANRAKDVGRIREALDQGDYATISRLGHSMRGNGGSYGLPQVGAIGERIEGAANAKDAAAVRAHVDELYACVEQVCAAENVHVD